MTALPDPVSFAPKSPKAEPQPMTLQPNITQCYWGYEGKLNEQTFSVADIARLAASVFTIAAFVAACGVWLVPDAAFSGGGLSSKAMACAALLCIGALALRFASRGTRVRVQMDTSNGELREVVDGPFGTDIELSSYGLDTVRLVRVVTSSSNRSFGQIQMTLADGTTLPFADGSSFALRDLRDRIALDCGLMEQGPSRTAIWVGPLAA